MLRLDDIKPRLSLEGIELGLVVTVAAEPAWGAPWVNHEVKTLRARLDKQEVSLC